MKSEDILNIVHCVMVEKMSYQDTADLNHSVVWKIWINYNKVC